MAKETLRPEADGDLTNLTPVGAANNWECVKDVTPDDDTTHVETNNTGAYVKDLYQIKNHTLAEGTPQRVEITYRIYNKGYVIIKPDTTEYEGEVKEPSGWGTYKTVWNQNPETQAPWTWADIDKLQVGIALMATLTEQKGVLLAKCTQVYGDVITTVIPTVTTPDPTDIGPNSAKVHGTITDDGEEECSERGFDICLKEAAPDWLSPTSHLDETDKWTDETKGYDENNATYANNGPQPPGGAKGGWLDFIYGSPFMCTGFKILCIPGSSSSVSVQVDFYYDDAWHTVYLLGGSQGWRSLTGLTPRMMTKARHQQSLGYSAVERRCQEFYFFEGMIWTEEGSYTEGSFDHIVTDLVPETKYYFRAKAKNSEGWGYGAWKDFTTTEETTAVGRSHGYVMS